MQISKYRDLTLIDIDEDKIITIACDSCGGIGESEADFIKISNDIVGYFTARVCLFETLSFGATPMVIVNNFCVEMEKRGQGLLNGINKAIDEYNQVGFSNKLLKDSVTGSTEENFKTLQTSLGMTIIGEKRKAFAREKIVKNDYVISIGLPKVGQDVVEDILFKKEEIASFRTLHVLINNINAKDILPVGSKGINYELSQIEEINNIDIEVYDNLEVDINKSSGPATTVLAVIKKESINEIRELIKEPINILGEVKRV